MTCLPVRPAPAKPGAGRAFSFASHNPSKNERDIISGIRKNWLKAAKHNENIIRVLWLKHFCYFLSIQWLKNMYSSRLISCGASPSTDPGVRL